MLKFLIIQLLISYFYCEESCGCSSGLNRNLKEQEKNENNLEIERKNIQELQIENKQENKEEEKKFKENMIYVEGGLFYMGTNKPLIFPVSSFLSIKLFFFYLLMFLFLFFLLL